MEKNPIEVKISFWKKILISAIKNTFKIALWALLLFNITLLKACPPSGRAEEFSTWAAADKILFIFLIIIALLLSFNIIYSTIKHVQSILTERKDVSAIYVVMLIILCICFIIAYFGLIIYLYPPVGEYLARYAEAGMMWVILMLEEAIKYLIKLI